MSVKLLIAGDYHIYGEFDKFIINNPHHDLFNDDFSLFIKEHDYRVFNLEDPITESTDGCTKYGPYGVGSIESLNPISKAGFHLATFATNHTYDMKNKGIIDTISACGAHNVDIMGGGISLHDASKPKRLNIKGTKISFLNYARTEFNTASTDHGGANPFCIMSTFQDIKHEKSKSDFVIVIIHEGIDAFDLPSPDTVKKIRFLTEANPDAIIMHHSQIPSGYEEHNGVPIFYSIGNLLHMTKNQKMHTGVLVSLTVSKTAKLDYEIIPIRFNMQQMKISMMLDVEKSSFIERLDELSEIVKNDKRLEQEWKKLVEHKRYTYLLSILGINPLLGRLLRKLRLSGVLSMLAVLKKKQLLALQNIMQCAIHREISIAMLEDLFGDKE